MIFFFKLDHGPRSFFVCFFVCFLFVFVFFLFVLFFVFSSGSLLV